MSVLVAFPLVQPALVIETRIPDGALGRRRVLTKWFIDCLKYTVHLPTNTAHKLNLDAFVSEFLPIAHSHSDLSTSIHISTLVNEVNVSRRTCPDTPSPS